MTRLFSDPKSRGNLLTTALQALYDELFGAAPEIDVKINYGASTFPDFDAETHLKLSMRRRVSRRYKSGITLSKEAICGLLSTGLGDTSCEGRQGYAIPTAGAVRDLRYIVCVRLTQHPQLFEFIPENRIMSHLIDVQFREFSIESWEQDSIFNLIYCYSSTPRRTYANNLLHLAFEAGCASQNISLLSTQIGANHCVSGILNVGEFRKMFGTSLIPMHMISVM
ncbi:hypothetical protein [Burkholderia gladioli]|uniref:hypothetical protein n=1 Tax=Burkholderia gladioli TaxID=28095 RepID=UPI001640499C|nr:hypothetical protein [Burkholderia gladioli]